MNPRSFLVRFSLVELMMAVAVTMVLAAIAVPMAYEMQLKARRAELDTNVDGLRTAELAYMASTDAWHRLPGPSGFFQPDATPSKAMRSWGGIEALGFAPDGEVRASYTLRGLGEQHCIMTPFPPSAATCSFDLCITGMTDLDVDGRRTCLTMTESDNTPRWSDRREY